MDLMEVNEDNTIFPRDGEIVRLMVDDRKDVPKLAGEAGLHNNAGSLQCGGRIGGCRADVDLISSNEYKVPANTGS